MYYIYKKSQKSKGLDNTNKNTVKQSHVKSHVIEII